MHATAVTCLNTGQQNRFQAALWRLLSDDHRFRYIVGYPEPRWEAHNRQVLLHTVLRREAFVTGSVIDFSQVSINDFPEAMQFLSNLKWGLDQTCNTLLHGWAPNHRTRGP